MRRKRPAVSVSMPPPGDGRASQVVIPHDARAALHGVTSAGAGPAVTRATGAGVGTGGTWATSQVDEAPPAKKSGSGALIAALVGLVLLGGGAAYAFMGAKKEGRGTGRGFAGRRRSARDRTHRACS